MKAAALLLAALTPAAAAKGGVHATLTRPLPTHARNGRYRALATVPPGGLGTVRIGLRGRTDVYFPIKRR